MLTNMSRDILAEDAVVTTAYETPEIFLGYKQDPLAAKKRNQLFFKVNAEGDQGQASKEDYTILFDTLDQVKKRFIRPANYEKPKAGGFSFCNGWASSFCDHTDFFLDSFCVTSYASKCGRNEELHKVLSYFYNRYFEYEHMELNLSDFPDAVPLLRQEDFLFKEDEVERAYQRILELFRPLTANDVVSFEHFKHKVEHREVLAMHNHENELIGVLQYEILSDNMYLQLLFKVQPGPIVMRHMFNLAVLRARELGLSKLTLFYDKLNNQKIGKRYKAYGFEPTGLIVDYYMP